MSRPAIWTATFSLTFAAHFVFALGFWTFLHLPGHIQLLGGGETQIGFIMATLSVSAIAIRPWLGRMMDVRGRRVVLWFGCITNLIACIAYLNASDLGWWIYAVRVVHGVGEAALFSVMFTIAADVVPAERRTEGIAIFGVSGLLPLSLGGLLGDAILEHWDYMTLFGIAAAIAGVTIVLCLPIRETRPQSSSGSQQRAGLLQVFCHRSLLPLWVVTLGFTMGITSYFSYLKTYIGKLQFGSVGAFFLAYSIASVSLRLFFSWLPDRLGPKRALAPAIASLIAGIILLAVATSATYIWIAGALCGLGHGFVFPIISALVVSRTQAVDRGVAITLFTALFDVGALAGAPLLGLIAENTGYTAMFIVASCTVIALSLVFFAWDRHVTRPAY